jgi:hypothetical protein
MILRWYRSWPMHTNAPPARDKAHVCDHLPRIEIDQFNYLSNGGLPVDKPGFCLLEWDIALASEERRRFATVASHTAYDILVAPYMLYPRDGNPECAHRYEGGAPVRIGSPVCDTFGLGCVYLPHHVIAGYMSSESASLGMTDASLSQYVLGRYGPTRIDWSFNPQHLSGD